MRASRSRSGHAPCQIGSRESSHKPEEGIGGSQGQGECANATWLDRSFSSMGLSQQSRGDGTSLAPGPCLQRLPAPPGPQSILRRAPAQPARPKRSLQGSPAAEPRDWRQPRRQRAWFGCPGQRKRDRSVSQATFLLAHIANSGPVPLSSPEAFTSPKGLWLFSPRGTGSALGGQGPRRSCGASRGCDRCSQRPPGG